VRFEEGDPSTCEFAITVAEDWRGSGLATQLLASLVRRARHDGYSRMEGAVIADNSSMLALARRLGFAAQPMPDDATVIRVERRL
jgi:acetyltransferase